MSPSRSAPIPARVRTTALDAELLRSRSLLIYCRASLTLSLLLYTGIVAMLYSDLYVHLIRQAANAVLHSRVFPDAFFVILAGSLVALAFRVKPTLEKAALLILALNIASVFFRQRFPAHSDAYLALCLVSLILDAGLLAAVVAFYRKYPNYLKLLRALSRD
jgi:hypothetical protein